MSEEKVIEMLMPKVQTTLTALVEGKLNEKIASLKTAMADELWDKACAEIGKRLNIPEDIIRSLQTIDDIVKSNKDMVDNTIATMIADVEAFKDRLKGVDLNETITMSYGDLQKVRRKAATSWATIAFFLGFFIGVAGKLFGLY